MRVRPLALAGAACRRFFSKVPVAATVASVPAKCHLSPKLLGADGRERVLQMLTGFDEGAPLAKASTPPSEWCVCLGAA